MSQTKTQLVEGLNINTSAPADALAVDNSGRVGIGTTSPGGLLEVRGGEIRVGDAGASSTSVGRLSYGGGTGELDINAYSTGGNTFIKFFTSFGGTNAERARIDNAGRLLVGRATARENLYNNSSGVAPQFQVEGTSYVTSSMLLVRNSNDGNDNSIVFGKTRGTSIGANTVVSSGDGLGGISFQGADGSDLVEAASIQALVDGTPGANDMPGRLVFSTTADGASSPTERLRLTSTGQLRLAGAGITFNGDTATANELDDYEEGTFTPTITGSTTTGTASYSTQSGKYTKIGRLVQFEVYIGWSSGTGAGNLQISGLPFTVSSSSSTYPAASIGYANDVTLSTTHTPLALLASGSSYIYFYQVPSGGGTNINVPYDSAGSFIVTGTYNV